MKILYVLCVAFAVMGVFCSCTNSENDKSDYVYYFGIDRGQDGGVMLYALIKNDVKKSEKGEKDSHIEEYKGDDVRNAFEVFFEKHRDAYTGTIKEYAVGESMGENGLEEFKVYLANSSKLPAKRKTHVFGSGAGFVYEKSEEE